MINGPNGVFVPRDLKLIITREDNLVMAKLMNHVIKERDKLSEDAKLALAFQMLRLMRRETQELGRRNRYNQQGKLIT